MKYGEGISNEAIIITIDPDKDKLDWNIKPTVSINNSLDLIVNKLSSYTIQRDSEEWLKELRSIEMKQTKLIDQTLEKFINTFINLSKKNYKKYK